MKKRLIKNGQERVVCASVWYDDGKKHQGQPFGIDSGFVVSGFRHGNCYVTLMDIICNKWGEERRNGKTVEGFLTTKNRFVDKKEAWKIAVKAKQVSRESMRSFLLSEDLY